MEYVKKLIYLFIFCSVIPGMNAQDSIDGLLKKFNSGDVPYVSVEELRMDQLKENVIILDARQLEEYEVSHIRNSIFIGDDNYDLSILDSLSKDSEIVVYCSLGVRSERASRKIMEKGFLKVRNLYGGIFQWKNKGFPVVDMEENPTEKVHVYSGRWAEWLKNGEKIY